MINKIRLLTLGLLLFISLGSYAQVPEVKTALRQIVGTNGTVNMSGYIKFWTLPSENRTFVFSILINIDDLGEIKAVNYLGRTALSDSTLHFRLITQLIKQDKHAIFKKFKNVVIVAPIWVKEVGGAVIKTTPEFMKSMEEIIPENRYQIKNKQTLVLPVNIIEMYKPIS
jgi:hypothetical protein